ncbi:PRC-barrel domain-containing protein [Devosia sp. 66-22]|uniref:PRC-barrel domain-containing protein n=1 Tax=Devosia sp. 66-22 TaxID=1895753 RepID=UPI000A7BFC24|nr:PRC-barrel domain-containing protein [Devosia sp. 66-22]
MPTATGHTTAIRASRVIGTDVKDTQGEVIGKVEDLILDKTDNAIMFAVVGFGGFLGMGEKFHPLPWSSLDFDPELDAYVVPFSKDQLKAAPADTIKELTKDDGTFMRDRSYDYYKPSPTGTKPASQSTGSGGLRAALHFVAPRRRRVS